jgi:hypothetical chaperone protein
MFSGFDYGTSNCAVGVIEKSSGISQVKLLPLEQGRYFMPSALYALERELICEEVGLHITNEDTRNSYVKNRAHGLDLARSIRHREGIGANEQCLFVGQEAFDEYMAMPGEGYFVKSPKSFLGASGLRPESICFFEDIVTAMMQSIKAHAQRSLGHEITHTVIGRPVNFQGLNAEKSNKQAIDILTIAAKRAGFSSVEFLFEPIAAGLAFETDLSEDKTVLVVDIGGGTTDCAMVRMGPSHKNLTERKADFLGHSGERVGGNDLDIQLAGHALMPLFGMNSVLKSGLPLPPQTHWDAVSTNNVGAQSEFNGLTTTLHLEQLLRDTCEPELMRRFISMRKNKQQHHVVRSAEQCKIDLTDQQQCTVDLSYIESQLSCEVTREVFSKAIQRPITSMVNLMDEAIKQAGCQPDLIFVTGGSAKSPVIRQAVEQKLGAIPVVDGDHFGSVASGLTVWAERIFA